MNIQKIEHFIKQSFDDITVDYKYVLLLSILRKNI